MSLVLIKMINTNCHLSFKVGHSNSLLFSIWLKGAAKNSMKRLSVGDKIQRAVTGLKCESSQHVSHVRFPQSL